MSRVAKSYARHARPFDRARSRSLMERPYLRQAMDLVPPPADVLDLGCGGGEPIARHMVDNGYRVTGVDIVDEMITMCKARLPAMTWHRADMRQLDLARQFDLVIAWDSLFHLSPGDQRQMFPILSRHTAPGGILIFTSGLAEGESSEGNLFGDALYHASLDSEEYARILDQFGYDVILHRAEDPDCGDHTIWLAQLRDD